MRGIEGNADGCGIFVTPKVQNVSLANHFTHTIKNFQKQINPCFFIMSKNPKGVVSLQFVDTLTAPIKQNLSLLKQRAYDMFPLLRPIKTKTLLSTDQYNVIYPYVADYLFQSIPLTDIQIFHYTQPDAKHNLCRGFTIIENQTMQHHNFLFTYAGTWLYNNTTFVTLPKHVKAYTNKLIHSTKGEFIYE